MTTLSTPPRPPDSPMPRPFRMMRVRIGEPVDVTRYAERADDRLVLRQITDEVMFEIRNLSGQEYVDSYATKKAEDLPSAAPVRIVSESSTPSGNGDRERRSSAEVLRAAAS